MSPSQLDNSFYKQKSHPEKPVESSGFTHGTNNQREAVDRESLMQISSFKNDDDYAFVKGMGTQTSSSNLIQNPLSGYVSSQQSSKASLNSHSHYG